MKKIFKIAIFALAIIVSLFSLRYFAAPHLIVDEGWAYHLFNHPIATYFHFACGPLALLTGTIQFFTRFGKKTGPAHKWIGRAYVSSVCLAALAAMPLALETESGPIAASGFFLLAVLWLCVTVHATWLILVGNVSSHKRWMTRSYTLTYSGVVLRLMVFIFTDLGGLDYDVVYPMAAWLCWLLPLTLVELSFVRSMKKPGKDLKLSQIESVFSELLVQ